MKTLMKILFITLLCLPITLSAQWTDSGTRIRTNDNVNIGGSTDAHALYVRTNKVGWQGGFVNQQGGKGAKIYIGHGNGYGMFIEGGTTASEYTLQLNNADERTNIFYNNGKVGLGLAGNVGIGTASPVGKLDVRAGSGEGLRIISDHGNTHLPYSNGSSYIGGENIVLRTTGNNTERMRVTSNGNVGIGTTSPIDKLDVNGTVRAKGIKVISDYGDTYIPYSNDISYIAGKMLILRTDGNNERMRINTVGNVGIGTTSPNNKLDVNGTIRAKEIKVESDWSDYVFYDDYQLPTLEEEEKYIEAKGHLLGFESEQEMEGMIHLGDVSRRQQAKIEEIMLHLIELKKEVMELKEENEALKK